MGGTELEPLAPGSLELIVSGKFDVQEVAASLTAPPPAPPERQPFPPLPGATVLTDEQEKAITALPQVFGFLHLTERRSLSGEELKNLAKEARMLAQAAKAITDRAEEIKEIVRHHSDVAAEEAGVAIPGPKMADDGVTVIVPATARDQKGHYLLARPQQPHRIEAPGFSDSWEQRYVSGGVSFAAATQDLKRLHDEEKITRPEFLGFTRAERVFDEDLARSYIRRNPVRGLQVLRAITRQAAPSASLYSPKN